MQKELQLENGNYTRIINKVLEELVKTPLLGAELAVCIFIIRKTWGYNKNSDEISLTQFEHGVNRSRPTIVKALKNLQLVNIIQLVKVGDSKSKSSEWKFNKYYNSWKVVSIPLPVEQKSGIEQAFSPLVKTSKLVKFSYSTSKANGVQLVKGSKHTKDNTKYNTKDSGRVTRVKAKSLKEKKPIEVYTEERLEAILCDMEKKEDSHLNIIATYIREKPVKIENSQQLTLVISRFGKVASQMVGAYTNQQIFKAIDDIKKENKWKERKGEAVIDWTIETVLKKLVKN